MGKKVKEYKSGDFIFAKVKGYPAWPARVQKLNGKKYFVYFYGTGETANLPPTMIFDYAANKSKFLAKAVKRRFFSDGVKQIEYDFANNVPLEQVIGVPVEVAAEGPGNDTMNDSAIDATMDDSAGDTTANDTAANDTLDNTNATQNDTAVEDSDEAGALVIDEGTKAPTKGRKSKVEAAKTPAKEVPKAKEPKIPRGKAKKDEAKEKDKEEDKEKNDEELVSRSGRKIRPKRYIDEQTEENATLPSPAAKRRRAASPAPEKEKADGAKEKGDAAKEKGDGAKEKTDAAKENTDAAKEKKDKTFTQFNAVKLSELEGLKGPFKPVDEEKDNILIAYLPNGSYVGVKLFQSRPNAFKNEASQLQWEKQAAANAVTLKTQLERDQITLQSVQGQLVMDLNLTDEEKAALDKERETEEKKSRVNFLKTEMKLIELDAKIKTCLSLERADTELCLTLLDELLTLDVKPLMLLKHPTCLETVKRMRAYVGNTPSWDLSEAAALLFTKQAHKIRKKADLLYKNMKELFQTPDGLSFWEFFSERVRSFKEIVANHNAGELLEMVHEPLELDQPNAHTMKSAIEHANSKVPPLPEDEEDKQIKKKGAPGKSKKTPPANGTPSKSKRQSSRNKTEDDKPTSEDTSSEPLKPAEESTAEKKTEVVEKTGEIVDSGTKAAEDIAVNDSKEGSKDTSKEQEVTSQEANQDVEMADAEKPPEIEQNSTETTEKEKEKNPKESEEKNKEAEKSTKEGKSDKNKDTDKPSKEEKTSKKDKKSKEDKSESDKSSKDGDSEKSSSKSTKDNERSTKDSDKSAKDSDKSAKDSDKSAKDSDKSTKDSDKSTKESEKSTKDSDKSSKDTDKSAKSRDKSPKPSKEDKHSKDSERKEKRSAKDSEKSSKDSAKNGKESDKGGKEDKSDNKEDKDSADKEKQESGEPRAKRSRESKKTEPPPPRSPAKRKSKN